MSTYLKDMIKSTSAELVAELENKLVGVSYHVSPGQVTTCQLHLNNGFVVQGMSFGSNTKAQAMERARKRAVAQALFLEQYLATERLYQESLTGYDDVQEA